MDLSSFGKTINSVKSIEMFRQLKKDTVEQGRFTVKNNEMILQTVEKSKFAKINNKSTILKMELFLFPFFTRI